MQLIFKSAMIACVKGVSVEYYWWWIYQSGFGIWDCCIPLILLWDMLCLF